MGRTYRKMPKRRMYGEGDPFGANVRPVFWNLHWVATSALL